MSVLTTPVSSTRTSSRPVVSVAVGRVALLAIVLVGWNYAAAHSSAAGTLASPAETAKALGHLVAAHDFWVATYDTLRNAVVGLCASAVAGIAIGLVLASQRFAYQSASLLIDFLRTVPGLTIMPLGILVLGPTERLDFLMIVTTAVWPILLQTVYAVTQLDAEILETVAAYRIPWWRRFVFILLPACMPRIATGVRISASMALLLAIGTEILAGSPGLGSQISTFEQQAAYPRMYAAILVCGVLGVLCNAVIAAAERIGLRWHVQSRRTAP